MTLTSVRCTLCENKFGRYAVPIASEHRPVPQAILRGEVWEPETLDFILTHLDGKSVVDAGTYFGDFLPALSAAVGQAQKVYGFEPQPENFACAQWTRRLNGLNNVELANAGLGEGRAHGKMVTAQNGLEMGGASYIVQGDKVEPNAGGFKEVAIVALDDALPGDADIGVIHLDVEGYELPALRGAMRTIARCRPHLLLENTPIDVLERELGPLGYHFVTVIEGNALVSPLPGKAAAMSDPKRRRGLTALFSRR